MKIEIKLEAFEGPLDLLLHLIDKNKVNIYDIPIAQITEQYLDYVNQLREADMDSASEFLVMAATLVSIKTKMLLPPEYDEEGEEIDPRAELVAQLLEYKLVRYATQVLKGQQEHSGGYYYKTASIPEELKSAEPVFDLDEICEGVDISQLRKLFESLMHRQLERVDKVRSKFGKIEKEEVSLPEKLESLSAYAKTHPQFSFRDLISHVTSKIELIVTFMAILELIKRGDVTVSQDALFDDIWIESKVA